MNLLEKFDKLNNRLTSLLEENKELKQHYKILQEQHQELKEKLDERENERLNRQCKNLQGENMDLKQRILNQEKQKTNLLGKNEMLKWQCKNLQGENTDLKQRILNQEKQKTNLLGENEMLKRQCKNFQGENQNLKQKLNNLQDKFNESDYKNLQEENKELKIRLEERNKQYQQNILNLEKQKNEQLEIFSRNLEKALGKLELDELNEVNGNDIKNLKEKNKSTTFIDDDIKDKEYIQPIEDSSGSDLFPFNRIHRNRYPSSENECSQESFYKNDIRIVVGLDFGTTYSGFSYFHTARPKNIITNSQWPGAIGYLKTNTCLQYDYEYYQAIVDYLYEIGKVIKGTIKKYWCGIDFFQQVLLVLTVPAEYSEKEIAIMRDCVFKAGLIKERYSKNLRFTTEPEAVAIYCLNDDIHDILTIGSNFMVVDCGSGTVDLTTCKLLVDNKLSEITERTGDFCGIISRGAVMYGLSSNVISTRILKYTYGIEELKYWMEGDPISRRLQNGRIVRFHCLAKRGTKVETNQKFTTFFAPPFPLQTRYFYLNGNKIP
ncbi:unnamed protein product [Rhizophagus irregularis]|uniref:Actin-like ATPase domain-containing protein n=1 Tax=Rhizophagus irregularis TaxID=588596 RepID=A0A915ZJ71_9GLOM|nr:unnamed protein product [Rhizophagus irregularis]